MTAARCFLPGFVFLAVFSSVSIALADWPQWRGPNRDGVSTDTTPITDVLPAEGLKKVWESEFIPSDHMGGHGSPVVAGEQVFISVVWHDRVPSEQRVIDTEAMQALNYRGVQPELQKKMEEDRLALNPRLRGDKLEEWIAEWRKKNLTPKEDVSLGTWVASRFKAGKTAFGLEWLDKIAKQQDKPFASADAFKKWLDDGGFPPEIKERMIEIVPNTIKVAKDVVMCLDINTGKRVWKFESEGKPTGRKSSSTAAVVDGRVFAMCSEHMYCLDQKDGKLVWKVALPTSGPGSSPLVVDGKVYVAAGRVACFSTADGKLVWEQKEVRGDTGSPVLWVPTGGKPVLVVNANNNLSGLDPASGKVLWSVEGGGQSTPVTSGDWLVVYSGAKDVGLRAYKFQAGGPPKAAWSHFWTTLRYTGSPIIHEGNVYLTCGGKHQCIDLETGAEKWKTDASSTITSPLLADGKIIVYENNGSHVAIIKAGTAGYEQLARAKVEGMGCTSPALSNGRLIVRQKEKLACFDLRPAR